MVYFVGIGSNKQFIEIIVSDCRLKLMWTWINQAYTWFGNEPNDGKQ